MQETTFRSTELENVFINMGFDLLSSKFLPLEEWSPNDHQKAICLQGKRFDQRKIISREDETMDFKNYSLRGACVINRQIDCLT